jgi:hypothetical protein
MRMTLKKIIEMEIPFGNPIEITTTGPRDKRYNEPDYLSKNKHLGYYQYTSHRENKNNKTVPVIVYYTENGSTNVEISKIKEVKVLEYK